MTIAPTALAALAIDNIHLFCLHLRHARRSKKCNAPEGKDGLIRGQTEYIN